MRRVSQDSKGSSGTEEVDDPMRSVRQIDDEDRAVAIQSSSVAINVPHDDDEDRAQDVDYLRAQDKRQVKNSSEIQEDDPSRKQVDNEDREVAVHLSSVTIDMRDDDDDGRARDEVCLKKTSEELKVDLDKRQVKGEQVDDEGMGVAVRFSSVEPDSSEIQEVLDYEGRAPDDEYLRKRSEKFKVDCNKRQVKMHRFPTCLRDLGSQYIVPEVVAIGPYHHGKSEKLKEMEKVKHVAARHFITNSVHTLEVIYGAVIEVSDQARRLYADDVVADIDDICFQNMMFYDACFLVEFIIYEDEQPFPELQDEFACKKKDIHKDIMLLENQIPWLVVEAVLRFRASSVTEEVMKKTSRMGQNLTNRLYHTVHENSTMDSDYSPPHLLGLIRSYKISKNTDIKVSKKVFSTNDPKCSDPSPDPAQAGATCAGLPFFTCLKARPKLSAKKKKKKLNSMSVCTSAIQLAEIGIKLKASKTGSFKEIGLTKSLLFGELCMTPLVLNEPRASWLVNMAAHEVCTISWNAREGEGPAICSYLALLSMLMNREEDVHELRKKHILQGLTNKEMLDFFKSLNKHLSVGRPYVHILEQIENYQVNRRMWIKVHKFMYNT